MLVARQSPDPAGLQHGRQALQGEGSHIGADGRVGEVQSLELLGERGVVGATGLEVGLPAVAGDRHLEDLRGSFVDRGDPDVATDLLHEVGTGVAVAPVCLDGSVGRGDPRLGGQVLGDGALGVEGSVAAVTRVDQGRGLLDDGAGRLQSRRMGNDELVGVALLLAQRGAALHPFGRVADRAVQAGPASAQPERRDHQAGVSEDLLGLHQPAPFDPAHQVVSRHDDVVEEEGGGVGQPDAVLVLGRRGGEPLGVALHDEPGRPSGRQRQHGVEVSDAAVADPLLAPVDPVAGASRVVRHGRGRHRTEVTARLGLGGAVGEEHALVGDPTQPLLALLLGAAHQDRVAAQERREDRRAHPDVDPGHPLADAVGVERVAAHAAVRLGDEGQLYAEGVAAHRPHRVLGTGVLVVELEESALGQLLGDEVVECLEHQVEGAAVQPWVRDVHEGVWRGSSASLPGRRRQSDVARSPRSGPAAPHGRHRPLRSRRWRRSGRSGPC